MTAAAGAHTRVRSLDLLRLVAAVQMVQGHTIDAVLALDARQGELFSAWVWLRGLTSVAFLFATGMAFHLVALRDFERRRADRNAVARRLRRAGWLVALGYALHAPLAMLWGDASHAGLEGWMVVDILQCIGVSLALLEGAALALPSARAVRIAAGAAGLGALAAAGWLEQLDPRGAYQPLLNYVSARAGSLFPLVPWAAHVLLAVALAPWLLASSGTAPALCGGALMRARALRMLVAGALLIACSFGFGQLGAATAAMHLTRLGGVLLGFAALEGLEPATRSWPAWTMRLSAETLFIYAFHVVLVYGAGVGLSSLIGPRLSVPAALVAAVLVVGLSFGLALVYRRFYQRAAQALAGRTATG